MSEGKRYFLCPREGHWPALEGTMWVKFYCWFPRHEPKTTNLDSTSMGLGGRAKSLYVKARGDNAREGWTKQEVTEWITKECS